MAQNSSLPERDARVLSALAHGSAIAQGLGILVGVVLYVTQRERSKWVAFQALQAAVFQFVGLLVTMGLWLAWGILHGLSYIPIIRDPQAFDNALPPLFWISLGAMAIPFAVMIVWGLYGLLGALQTLRGRDFRYLVIGRLLESGSDDRADTA